MVERLGLICPVSGHPCEYFHYCASLKEQLDEPVTSPDGEFAPRPAEELPDLVKDAVDGEFCSTRRLDNLGRLASESPKGSVSRIFSVILSGQISAGREMFYEPSPESVERTKREIGL